MHKAEIAVYMSTISAFLSLSGEGEYYAEKLIFDVYKVGHAISLTGEGWYAE